MAVVSALTLVVIGALIHGSCALKCYECSSDAGSYCDDKLDTDHNSVKERTCPSTANACIKAKGSRNGEEGAQRSCIATTKSGCHDYDNEYVAELHADGVTGTICYCTDDLCNSAHQTSAGRMALGLAAISLLALALQKLLIPSLQ